MTDISFGVHRTLEIDGRTVEVWEPPQHAAEQGIARPLLLAHDGQNLFLPGRSFGGVPWGFVQACEAVLAKFPDVTLPYVIAPWNRPDLDRARDYAPQRILQSVPLIDAGFQTYFSPTQRLSQGFDPQWAGDDYVRWCADVLIPSVSASSNWNVDRTNIAVMGSSMGGLASAYAISLRPDVYSTALCVSTHWTPGGHELSRSLTQMLPTAESGARIWFDHGTENLDATYGEFQLTADVVMRERGFESGRQWQTTVYEGADHNEDSWSQRLPDILSWWLHTDD